MVKNHSLHGVHVVFSLFPCRLFLAFVSHSMHIGYLTLSSKRYISVLKGGFSSFNNDHQYPEGAVMLSRGTSNASYAPERVKSTSSIEYGAHASGEANILEPEKGHQVALTAANLAYERANPYQAVQRGHGKSRTEKDNSKVHDFRTELSRRQSVRFVGPNAVPIMTRSITRREAQSHKISHEAGQSIPPARPIDFPTCSNETYGTAWPEEFNEHYVASEPSSYRKLRKANSMFSTRKAQSSIFAVRTPISTRSFQRHPMHSSSSTSESMRVPDPRLKRSYSFLRGVADRISSGEQHHATHDTAIQLARDTYLQQLEQQRLKERPSFLNLGRRQKSQKAFRRTVRTSSTNSYGTGISSPLSPAKPDKPSDLGSKARTFSQNWKEKLKRVFKRSSSDEGTIPIQHLNATQAHYGDPSSASYSSGHIIPPIAEPDTEILRRVSSRESWLRREPIYAGKISRPRSIRSLGSDDGDSGDKSRVTSWTNSTAANTISMPIFRERKRLSVIKEDGGPHQSSSLPAQVLSNGLETQRIFSALRKQIEKSQCRVELEDDEMNPESGFGQKRDHHSVSVPGQNLDAQPTVQRIQTTLDSDNQHHCEDGLDSFSSAHSINVDDRSSQAVPKELDNRWKHDFEESWEAITPQQTAEINESSPSSLRRPLRERRSAFFPPSLHIERSNMSPYRRAMYANNEDGDGTIRSGFDNQRAIFDGRFPSESVTGSESIYSGSTKDQDLQPGASSASVAQSGDSHKEEITAIMAGYPSAHKQSARPSFPPRYSSTKWSGDCKSLMTSKAVHPEKNEQLQRRQEVSDFSTKNSRHKKEKAQLIEDYVEIGMPWASGFVLNQPLGLLQGNVAKQPRSPKEETTCMFQNYRARDTQNENFPIRSSPMPSQKQSDMKEKPMLDVQKAAPCDGCRKTLDASLISENDPQRCSPERAERLRRLKRKSVTMLRRTPSPNEKGTVLKSGADPEQQKQDSTNSKISGNTTFTQAGMNTKLVNTFLRDRRRDMRISEESGTDPAFI